MAKLTVVPLSRLVEAAKSRAKIVRIAFLSLTYNDHFSSSYVFDTLMEPAMWFVDSFTKLLGPMFVTGVIVLTTSVIFIAYYVGLPYYMEYKNGLATTAIVILGQYLKLNIVFNYVLAYFTHPGRVPLKGENLKEVTSVCKKCIGPKPPRTHHCSVCDACVLKMDHHCPWLNGCVGHFNHRYFFLYMSYMVLGCFFIMVFGFEILYDEVFNSIPPDSDKDEFVLFSRRNLIFYEAFVVTGTFVILGGLTLWHAALISRGETSIEAHINKSEVKRFKTMGKRYKNPYDFSPWHNWCLFLGMVEGRGWSSILWPSFHKPKGDGLVWDSIYSCDIKWNDFMSFDQLDPAKLA